MARAWILLVAVTLSALSGCARGPGGPGPAVPTWVIEFVLEFAAPVNDASFYFIAIDADGDFGVDAPLPVAAGPYWGNGWGTGSMTHFISYTQGRYDVYSVNRRLDLISAGGGIVDGSGSPHETDTGQYELTVGDITLGTITLGGTGPITAVTNESDQNAGKFSIQTDPHGRTVPGGVSFAPAANGGRRPNAAEQAALDALNAGVELSADSLAAFGLRLELGPPVAGVQTIEVGPTTAQVQVRLRPTSGGGVRTSTGTLTANSSTPTATPPIPGASIRTETLVRGGTARFISQTAPTSTLIGPPYEAVPPMGGSQLDVTIALDTLGRNIDNLSVNFISTTELIFDPNVTDPRLHCYDALGSLPYQQGNAYVTFSVRQTRTISNGEFFAPETGGDRTLAPDGPFTQQERDAVDLIDWQIVIRRLSG